MRQKKRVYEELRCETCSKPVPKNAKRARLCLETVQANAVLCADKYDKNASQYGSSDIPAKLPNMCYAASNYRQGVNFTNALAVLDTWKTHGIPVRAEKYLFWNHPELAEYLDSHHALQITNLRSSTTACAPVSSEDDDDDDDEWITDEESDTASDGSTTSTFEDEDSCGETPASPQPLEDSSKGWYDYML